MLGVAHRTRAVSILGALVLGLVGSRPLPCRAASGELPPDVQAVIREEFESPDAETRYLAGAIDLDGDGKPEILVHVVGRMACGTGGCPTLVFAPTASGYRLVSTIAITRAPIRAAATSTRGWRDLVVRVGGGGTKARDVELTFDGQSYPGNPTVPGTRVVPTTGEGAEVVIATFASFEDTKPLPKGDDAPAPAAAAPAAAAPAAGPSFDCAKAATPVEKAICGDAGLAGLDRALAAAYTRAMREWPEGEKATQRSAQRAWIADRNRCAKAADLEACVEGSYRRRLIEVQIGGGQLMAPTPVAFVCQGLAETPFTAAYYNQTEPKSAVFTFGDRQVIAVAAPTGSGARYSGPDVDFWEHQGEAAVTWSGVKYRCKPRR